MAEIFWGLWLFPFGICVMRSGFIPRFIGVLLMIAGSGYVPRRLRRTGLPAVRTVATRLTGITNFCELPVILWLLIWGAKPQRGQPSSRLIPCRIGGPIRLVISARRVTHHGQYSTALSKRAVMELCNSVRGTLLACPSV